jgi:hypothetical protein
MDKKYLLDILLFLTELKTKSKINGKSRWELEKHIDFIKLLLDNFDQLDSNKKDKSKSGISRLIKWIAKFLMSP